MLFATTYHFSCHLSSIPNVFQFKLLVAINFKRACDSYPADGHCLAGNGLQKFRALLKIAYSFSRSFSTDHPHREKTSE